DRGDGDGGGGAKGGSGGDACYASAGGWDGAVDFRGGRAPPPPTLGPKVLERRGLVGDQVWRGVRTCLESPDHFVLCSTRHFVRFSMWLRAWALRMVRMDIWGSQGGWPWPSGG